MSGDIIDFTEVMRRQAAIDNAPTEAQSEQSKEAAVQEKRQAFTLLDASDLTQSEPMQWKMKGLVPWRGVGQVYGASMSAKTFLLVDYCVHQARGEVWYGHRTKACPIVYLCLEGGAGFKNRIRAYEKWTGRAIPENMRFILEPFDISSKGDVAKLAPLVPKGALVVIDTQNASSPFVDENSARDMGGIVDGAKRLADAVEGFVLLVAHCGKDGSKGARGSSVQLPSWDFCAEVKKHPQDKRSWRVVKSKDGMDGAEHFFKLDMIYLGRDEDGDAITSCVASPDTVTKNTDKPLTKSNEYALESLKKTLQEKGTGSVHIDDWRPVFYGGHTADKADSKRKSFDRARKELVSANLIYVNNDIYSINTEFGQTDKGGHYADMSQ